MLATEFRAPDDLLIIYMYVLVHMHFLMERNSKLHLFCVIWQNEVCQPGGPHCDFYNLSSLKSRNWS